MASEFPVLYEKARGSLAECVRIDECKDWSDKARALASYAKQAKDETMLNNAKRIALRATRRYGELLEQVEKAQGRNHEKGGRTPPSNGRYAAGRAAGLSNDQIKDGIRIARIPEDQFERITESARPPTVTEAAALGKSGGAKRAISDEALWLWGRLRDFERMGLIDIDPTVLIEEMTQTMREDVRRLAPLVSNLLRRCG